MIFLAFISTFLNFVTLPAWYKYSGPYDLDNKFTDHRKGELYFYFDHKTWPVNTVNGYTSWNDTYTDSSFTAYFVNVTDTVVNLIQQDGSLMMIQEARDQSGKWSPIEVWYMSDCGNSYFNSPAIGTNQYLKIPIPKYKGSFKTKLRLKLKLGKEILYSDPFDGSVDPEQFKKIDVSAKYDYKSYLDE